MSKSSICGREGQVAGLGYSKTKARNLKDSGLDLRVAREFE
ncbi:hypothetical protein [Desulfovibrio sp. JC010]|nr:hypothetical protein [Desulfovibrio sp. JC010]